MALLEMACKSTTGEGGFKTLSIKPLKSGHRAVGWKGD